MSVEGLRFTDINHFKNEFDKNNDGIISAQEANEASNGINSVFIGEDEYHLTIGTDGNDEIASENDFREIIIAGLGDDTITQETEGCFFAEQDIVFATPNDKISTAFGQTFDPNAVNAPFQVIRAERSATLSYENVENFIEAFDINKDGDIDAWEARQAAGFSNKVNIEGVEYNLIIGTDENDKLHTTTGNDILIAGAGNDSLNEGHFLDAVAEKGGQDLIFGGSGDDFLRASGALFDVGECSSTIYGNSGNDKIYATDMDIIYGGAGDDYVHGSIADNSIYGEDGNDEIDANLGDDCIKGGDGDDYVQGNLGHDSIDGGNGNDYLEGDPAWANFVTHILERNRGVVGNDVIFGGNGDDIIKGYGGDDILDGGNGNDYIEGGAGHDILLGQGGNDVLDGGIECDLIDGGEGDDILYGGSYFDLLIDYSGNNTFDGQDGDDAVFAGKGENIVKLDLGNDRVYILDTTKLNALEGNENDSITKVDSHKESLTKELRDLADRIYEIEKKKIEKKMEKDKKWKAFKFSCFTSLIPIPGIGALTNPIYDAALNPESGSSPKECFINYFMETLPESIKEKIQ